MCYGGVLCVMAVYCMFGQCIVCYGGALCGSALCSTCIYVWVVYCAVGRYTICHSSILYVMAVYCVVGRCIVC